MKNNQLFFGVVAIAVLLAAMIITTPSLAQNENPFGFFVPGSPVAPVRIITGMVGIQPSYTPEATIVTVPFATPAPATIITSPFPGLTGLLSRVYLGCRTEEINAGLCR